MKAILSIFLIFAHLFSTVGFSMEVHECAGEKSYSFFGISLNSLCQCDHESQGHDKGCCKDKKTIVKAKQHDKQISKTITAKNSLVDFDINNSIEFFYKDVVINNPSSLKFGTKHPPDHSPPLYILYNVFLI
jgi:hypothetical protein